MKELWVTGCPLPPCSSPCLKKGTQHGFRPALWHLGDTPTWFFSEPIMACVLFWFSMQEPIPFCRKIQTTRLDPRLNCGNRREEVMAKAPAVSRAVSVSCPAGGSPKITSEQRSLLRQLQRSEGC